MKQFAVGDKVRRVNYAGLLEIGGVYTVSNVSIKGLIGVKEFTSEYGDKTPFDVTNFELVSKLPETSEKSEASDSSESDIVKAWFDKVKYVTRDNSPYYVDYALVISDMGAGMWIQEETIDMIINVYDEHKRQEKEHNKRSLLDKKADLELQLAEINKQLGESV